MEGKTHTDTYIYISIYHGFEPLPFGALASEFTATSSGLRWQCLKHDVYSLDLRESKRKKAVLKQLNGLKFP